MTEDKEKRRFEKIGEAVDEAILAASEEEIVAEFREAGLDPSVEAAKVRDRIKAALLADGKRAMQTAKDGVRRSAASPQFRTAATMDPAAMRAKLSRLLQRPGIPTTLAAREGKDMSDTDVESLLADLAEVGVTDEPGSE